MTIIIDSKIYFYLTIQRSLPLTSMFPFLIKEIQAVRQMVGKGHPIRSIIFSGDLGKSQYRQSIYPQYKGHRNYPSSNKAAQESYIGAIPHIAQALDMIPAYVSNVEADDVSGMLTHLIRYNTDEKIILLTNDHDWRQLVLKYDDVYIKSLRYSALQDKSYVRKEEGVDTFFEFLLKKAMIGDVSDNIKGLHYCGRTLFIEFLRNLQATPGYDEMAVKEQFQLAVDSLPSLPKKVVPHKYYFKDGEEVTLADALKVNFQLGEILTNSRKLGDDQKTQIADYAMQVQKRITQNKPITPNIAKANALIEDLMPFERNEFGGPAIIPESYGAILALVARG